MRHPEAGWGPQGRDVARGRRPEPHQNAWADPLRELAEGTTVKVSPGLPEYAYRLYAALGVTAVVDESLPRFVRPYGLTEKPGGKKIRVREMRGKT